MLRLRKTSGVYKDFGKTFHEVWGEASINYTGILVALFGKEAPDLNTALINSYGSILQFSKVYGWQEALLPVAIEVHNLNTTELHKLISCRYILFRLLLAWFLSQMEVSGASTPYRILEARQ